MPDADRLAVHIAAGEITTIAKQIEAQVDLRHHSATLALAHWSGHHADVFRRQCDRQYREGKALVDTLRAVARYALTTVTP
ncbi:MAG: hypothetical protein AB7L13_02300 [Acidimicrobiia bacterium]